MPDASNKTSEPPVCFAGLVDGRGDRFEVRLSGPVTATKLRNLIRVLELHAGFLDEDECKQPVRSEALTHE